MALICKKNPAAMQSPRPMRWGTPVYSPTASDSGNLMWAGTVTGNPSISSWQAAVVRWSRHCVYF
jgi:hypothetical protein